MKSHPSVSSDSSLRDPPDFSVVLGGPLFQLLRRAHLSDNALMLVRQRIISISLFVWLPPRVLAALEGQALGGTGRECGRPLPAGRGSAHPLPGDDTPFD